MNNIFMFVLTSLFAVHSSFPALESDLPAPEDERISNQHFTEPSVVKIGLYGIGLDVYWEQFNGLKDRLEGYQKNIADRIKMVDENIQLVNTGIVDSPVKAKNIGQTLAAENVDAIFLFISTYALSSTVLPVVQQLKVPVIVLSLQPTKSIDYNKINSLNDRGKMTGEWLAYCQACAAPEIASVFNKADIDYHLIAGSLDDESIWEEISDWIDAIKVSVNLRDSNIGLLGHYYGGMLDVYSDLTQLSTVFGSHFEILEMSTLYKYFQEATELEIDSKVSQFHEEFSVDEMCSKNQIINAAKGSIALERLVKNKDLDALAYYYSGSDDLRYVEVITSLIPGNTLLTQNHVPVAGEYEVKNVIAMKILDLLEAGGSFSEFYAMDLNDDVILLGHDGPGHAAIAEGDVQLVPLPVFHGKPGDGLSIQMRVKEGPITLLSLLQGKDGGITLLVAEGESVPGPTLEIGNTNSRYRFSIGAKQFLTKWSQEGPSHHMAIGIGHLASKLEKCAKIFGVRFIKI